MHACDKAYPGRAGNCIVEGVYRREVNVTDASDLHSFTLVETALLDVMLPPACSGQQASSPAEGLLCLGTASSIGPQLFHVVHAEGIVELAAFDTLRSAAPLPCK